MLITKKLTKQWAPGHYYGHYYDLAESNSYQLGTAAFSVNTTD